MTNRPARSPYPSIHMRLIPFFCLGLAASPLASAKLPLLVAHRGASHAAPENTISSFKLAFEEGADGIEGDFYLTPDGQVVCIHDKDTKRVSGTKLVVEETPWTELSKLDVGSWKDPRYKGEHMPLLGDVLDMLPEGKMFYLEIKDGVEIVEPLRRILEEKKADPKRVFLISFNSAVVAACREKIPQFQAHLISALDKADQPGKADGYFAELERTGAQGLQFQATAAIEPAWLAKVKATNRFLAAWTVDDVEIARRMISLGVDSLTTNRPGDLRKELLSTASRWNVRDHIPLEDFMIQSHRGAGELSPENSKESFELAWSLGTIPEADIRTTKDGVIVAFHDNNFARILPTESDEMKKKGIADFTWDEITHFDIGAWKGENFKGQRVPCMTDVFAMLKADPKRRIYVDIKNVDLKELADQAHAEGLASRLILASTVPSIIREWKDLAPDSLTLHWMGGEEKALAERLAKLEEEKFAGIDQLQIHVKTTPDGITPSAEFLESTGATLRAHGILFQTLPWQSRDPALFQQLMDLGVASFATDYPDVAAAAVKSYYAAKK